MTVTVSSMGATTATLEWDGPAGTYQVTRNDVVINPLATSPYIQTDLVAGTDYAWRVESATHVGDAFATTALIPVGETWVSIGGQWVKMDNQFSADHSQLLGRDAPDSHPMSAITGLDEALDAKSDTNHSHAELAEVFVQLTAPTTRKPGDVWVDL